MDMAVFVGECRAKPVYEAGASEISRLMKTRGMPAGAELGHALDLAVVGAQVSVKVEFLSFSLHEHRQVLRRDRPMLPRRI